MINFIEGRIDLGAKYIRPDSSDEDIIALADEGLIGKRESGGGTYYYVESVVNDMSFGVCIGLREKRIAWLRLDRLEKPCKGWDDVSEEATRDEYRLLWNFVKKTVGRRPNEKRDGERTWRFKWGWLKVCYESRTFLAAIFMEPR